MRLIKLFFLFFLISSDVSAIEIYKLINTIKKDFNIIIFGIVENLINTRVFLEEIMKMLF